MELKSKNPLLSNKSFKEGDTALYDTHGNPVNIIDYGNTMTVQGAINKSFILLLLMVGGASLTWWMAINGYNPMVLGIAGTVIGLISVIAASFKPQYSPYLAPGYAFFQGLFVGTISVLFELQSYPGIVFQAIGGTFVTFMVCFLLYKFRIVKVNEQFKSVVIAATLAIATYYVISFILSFFGVTMFHHGNSLVSIGFSIFVIVIAALNLFMDFDLIEQGAKRQMPKYMEWFGAMALIVTLVWLYFEILRLLAKLQSRD